MGVEKLVQWHPLLHEFEASLGSIKLSIITKEEEKQQKKEQREGGREKKGKKKNEERKGERGYK